jgi:hypothetical protein
LLPLLDKVVPHAAIPYTSVTVKSPARRERWAG